MTANRIYLDNAATSWPKPEAVYAAGDQYLRVNGAPAGRGVYAEAVDVERQIDHCRQQLAKLINADYANHIVFTANGTDSLNMVIHGWLKRGDHVVTTVCEHNSVLRPLRYLEESGFITVTRVNCDEQGFVDLEELRGAIRDETRLMAVIHVSNVSGAILPIIEFGEIARQFQVPLLVDAAQSLGSLPLDVKQANIAFLAAPGHKGLFGPLGTGVLYVSPDFAQQLSPLRQGGTGTNSDEDLQPEGLPEKFESGNLNVPGIFGLAAGIEFVSEQSVAAIHEKNAGLLARLCDGLASFAGVHVYGPRDRQFRGGVVSMNVSGYDSREVAAILESNFRIQVRSGFHCAPLIHKALHTGPGGAVRFSPGFLNTEAQIDAVVRAMEEIAWSSTELGR